MSSWLSKDIENRFASTRFGRLVDFRRGGEKGMPVRLGFAASKRLIEELVADGETVTDQFYEALFQGVCQNCEIRTDLNETLASELLFTPARMASHEVAAIDLADRLVCVGDILFFTRITMTFCPVKADGEVLIDLKPDDERLSAKLWFRAIPIGRQSEETGLEELDVDDVVSAMSKIRDHRIAILDTIANEYERVTSDFIKREVKAEKKSEFITEDKGSISLFVLDAGFSDFQAFADMMERAADAEHISFSPESAVSRKFDKLLGGIIDQPVLKQTLSGALEKIKGKQKAKVVDLVESADRNGDMSLHFAVYSENEAEFFGIARAKQWVKEFEEDYRATFSKEDKLSPSRSPANKATVIMSNDLVINL